MAPAGSRTTAPGRIAAAYEPAGPVQGAMAKPTSTRPSETVAGTMGP